MRPPVWVRARDGALYKNPLLVFEGGFVCFDYHDPPELVLWHDIPAEVNENYIGGLLRRVFGSNEWPDAYGVEVFSSGQHATSKRVVPGTDPWEFRPATSYFFDVTGRIPRPDTNEGVERHAGRCDGHVIDWPAGPMDAHFLNPMSARMP